MIALVSTGSDEQLQRIGRTGRKRDGKVHVLMSEGREDSNWDSAQQTHREIQEEILHSRNLELFEDVEPLLVPGQFPKCVEQEMPVDPWDPADQKMKTRLPGSQDVKATETIKKSRGHEIPDDAVDGFMSVADLLKGKGKGKKRARSPTPVGSDDEDEDHDEEAENALLYGTVKSTTAKPPTKAQAKGKALGLAKKAQAVGRRAAADGVKKPKTVQPKETKEEKKKRLETEERTKMAIDFFNTYGPIRRRGSTPPATPPSSSPSEPERPARTRPSRTGLPLSPISDESLTKAGSSTTISPGTAALAGFSQLDAIDLSWDANDFDDDIEEVQAGPSRPTKPPLISSRSAAMMPPPPVPTSRPSVSPASKANDSPFNIRPGALRGSRRVISTSPIALVAPSTESPAPRAAMREAQLDDSSPLVPQVRRPRQARERRRPRVDKETVKSLVSLIFSLVSPLLTRIVRSRCRCVGLRAICR